VWNVKQKANLLRQKMKHSFSKLIQIIFAMKRLFVLFIIFPVSFCAQSDAANLQHLLENDSSSARLLLSYPDSIRNFVYTAAQYPQVVAKLGALQSSSSLAFQKLASKYSEERQKQLWDLSRYPELPSLIIANKGKRRKELLQVFSNYETHTKKAAVYFARHHSDDIEQMMNIQKNFNSGYREAVKNYPYSVKASFDQLLRYPELASVFSRDTTATRTLGSLYSQNPSLVKNVMDSASKQFAKEYSREFEDWKNGISSNPKVANDMKGLSRNYKKDSDYYEDDDVYATGAQEKVNPTAANYNSYNNYYVNPYPYWAGYPSWYYTPYWYPYPSWWLAGYYWYPNRSFYFYGMPAYHFGYWYYNHPNNYYYRYPHAGNYFYQHYQTYPRSNSGMNRAVQQWNGRRMGGGSFPAGGGRGGGGYGGGGGGRRR
jgi:hypothetical protein